STGAAPRGCPVWASAGCMGRPRGQERWSRREISLQQEMDEGMVVTAGAGQGCVPGCGADLVTQVFQSQRVVLPPLVPRAVIQHGAKAFELLSQEREAGVVSRVDVGVLAGQAEHEVGPAAAFRRRPGTGRLVLAVRRNRLFVSGIRGVGEMPAKDRGLSLVQGFLGAVREDAP